MGKESSSSNSSNPVQVFQWLNRMVSEPYYLFHFLTFFSYLIVRSSATQVLAPHVTHHLLRREIQTLLVFALLALVKGVKEETWEAFIADALFLAKICLFLLAFTMDRRLAIWYILVFLVIHMLTQQPPFEGLGTSSKLTPLQLESLLTEGTTTRLWLVEFRASYSPACIRSSQQFPELSITYSSKKLAFGIVDVGLFPNAAEKFGISLSGSMGQLPTFILFENAAEVARFPELDFEATYFHPTITKGLLSRHFELDRYLLEYINGGVTSSINSKKINFFRVTVMVHKNGKRGKPIILVTGTPGTGKTTVCTALAEATQLHHINVGELVKENNLRDSWDDELDCYVINEDLVCDELENVMEEGGNIVTTML